MQMSPLNDNNTLKAFCKRKINNHLRKNISEIAELKYDPNLLQKNDEESILIRNLKDAKDEWINADTNLNYVSENEFVEYYIYILKAAEIKYEFFLKLAKEKGLTIK